jgi:hypothetical protein
MSHRRPHERCQDHFPVHADAFDLRWSAFFSPANPKTQLRFHGVSGPHFPLRRLWVRLHRRSGCGPVPMSAMRTDERCVQVLARVRRSPTMLSAAQPQPKARGPVMAFVPGFGALSRRAERGDFVAHGGGEIGINARTASRQQSRTIPKNQLRACPRGRGKT